jgi:four helix bundle protein
MVYSFRELLTWQLARELEGKVHPLLGLESLKRDRRFRDQLSDASKSPARNIAEGFGRFSPGDFCRYYQIARASLDETENCLRSGVSGSYFPAETAGPLVLLVARCRRAIDKHYAYLQGSRDDPRFKSRKRPRKNNREERP